MPYRPPLRRASRIRRRAPLAAVLASALLALSAHAELAVRDDDGQPLKLTQPARRIVSLAPHITELLFAAGAGERVVGAVAYSDFPEAARRLPRVGGYSNVDMEAIAALKPDLVIAWKSGNREAHLDKLAALRIPVYMNEPRSLDDVARSLEAFGTLSGNEKPARIAAASFRARKEELAKRYGERPRVRMFYQIWDKPLMTVNDEHLISDVIRLCGGDNVFGKLAQLAPTVGVEAVLAADPEVIVASGMGDSHPEWLDNWKRWPKLKANSGGNLYFVPPELIQRHTPRILEGAAMLCEQLESARRKRSPGA